MVLTLLHPAISRLDGKLESVSHGPYKIDIVKRIDVTHVDLFKTINIVTVIL